jgi:hypothetical protein
MFWKLQIQYRPKKCISATKFLHFVIVFLIRIQYATGVIISSRKPQHSCGLQGISL